MTDALRVILEVGPKRRVVAAATDWPGLDRWGRTEQDALDRLSTYRARYVAVATRAGLAHEFTSLGDATVIERVTGSSSTDFWGIAHVPSELERVPLTADALEHRLHVLEATWAHFDDVADRVSAELRPGPRGGGWTRDEIIRHVYANEPAQFTRKVEVRTPKDEMLDSGGREAHRQRCREAILAYHRDGRPARTWPLPFLIRRMAHHVMDHAWELGDRDLDRIDPSTV